MSATRACRGLALGASLVDQPIFAARFGGKSILDPLRPFFNARDYTWRGFGAPGSAREAVAGRQTVDDRVVVRPGTFITTITGRSSAPPNDFVFDLVDVGSGRRISSEMIGYMTATGGKDNARFPGRALPFILPAPFVITDPGVLQIQITNLSAIANNICLFLTLAEPK